MTNNTASAPRLRFETTECTRCGGWGELEFEEGGRCFTCHGKGVKLTRRGRLARAFFDENLDLMNKALEDIVPGDRVWIDISQDFRVMLMRWATVTESKADELNEGRWGVTVKHKGKVSGLIGATREFAARENSGFNGKPTTLRVWNPELWDRAVGATALMPGASLDAPAKVAEEGTQAPKKEAAPRAARANGSHKDCTHESTPKARAACRKARAKEA